MKALFLIFIFSVTALGQNISAVTADGKKVILKSDKTWSFENEFPEEKKIDTNFKNLKGDSLIEIANILRENEKSFVKDEFETYEQYKNRILNFCKTINFKEKKLSDVVITYNGDFEYNAENQEFAIRISHYTVFPTNLGSEFNRNVSIDFVKDIQSGLFGFESYDFNFNIPSNKAREIKRDLSLAIFGTPFGTNEIGFIFKFLPSKFVIFNKNTGEIYFTQDNSLNRSNLEIIDQTKIKVVKAQAGDTVAKIAQRYGANATEVAKFNGLLPTSVLGAGRIIKIPLR